eukprot:CAMPEP_0173119308 /NCGR_PEP_ID=MMETSP1102-20130122/51688_1 /TAXON_ID=49646 /ORGANISM="Geminigera sp., Strain Caron Lab Isolate" /LENGTH=172 /DNA_ID=CAMNT_0014024849 /DNA_START=423 /DNA_END=941 /DNA_ORIENTATION=+
MRPSHPPAPGVIDRAGVPLRFEPPLFWGVGLPNGLIREGRVEVGVLGSGEARPILFCGGGVSVLPRDRSMWRGGEYSFLDGLRIPVCALPPRKTCSACATNPASMSVLSSDEISNTDDTTEIDSCEPATTCPASATCSAVVGNIGCTHLGPCESVIDTLLHFPRPASTLCAS